MDARAEAITVQREVMSPATGTVVLLEDQNLFPCLGERNRGGESARTRADDDHVVIGHIVSLGVLISIAWSRRAALKLLRGPAAGCLLYEYDVAKALPQNVKVR